MKFICLTTILLAAASNALALDDIPAGQLVWLQGITGIVATQGFEIDGTLRLESIDEPADIGLQVSPGSVTNAMTGTILSGGGAGGWRYIYGNLWNAGTIGISSPIFDLPGNGNTLENHGTINISPFSGLRLYGQNCLFDMEDGELHVSSPNGYVHIQNGEFRYNGGLVDGTVLAFTCKVTAAPKFANPIDVVFVGPHCLYEGDLRTNRSLTIRYEPRFGPVDLTLTNVEQLAGQIVFETTAPDSPAILNTGERGLIVATNGVITMSDGPGSGQIAGLLRVDGAVTNLGKLRVISPSAITNSGTWTLGPGGQLTAEAPLSLTGGALHLGGGLVTANGGLANQGGTIDAGGRIAGNVTNAGQVWVTNSDPIAVAGSWQQDPAGVITINLASGVPNAPALNVSGKLSLAGKLSIRSPVPLFPTNAQSYLLIAATNFSAGFASVEFPNRPLGLQWHLESDAHSLKLVALAGQPALALQASVAPDSGAHALEITGTLGVNLTVQRSLDLNHWTNFASFGTFGGYLRLPLDDASAGQSFYRADFNPAP